MRFFMLATGLLSLGIFSCEKEKFSRRGETRSAEVQTNTFTGTGDFTPTTPQNTATSTNTMITNNGTMTNTHTGGVGTGTGVIVQPQVCDATTYRVVNGGYCQQNAAIYVLDDGDSAACCPLPATDMLVGPRTQHKDRCPQGSVAVGVFGRDTLGCQQINPQRYRLGPPQKTCYWGSGVSGGSGAGRCSLPPPTFAAMTGSGAFGSDACLAVPFGSLAVEKTDKDCRDMATSAVFDVMTGQPVPMFR